MAEFDYKSLTMEQLQWVYQDVHFKRPPRWHQYVSLAFAEGKPRVCFWHGVGSGKTLAAYYTAMRKGCKRILVVCPKHSVSAWLRDVKWTDYSLTLVTGETPERKEKMGDDANVHVIPYYGLKTVFSSLKKTGGWTLEEVGIDREKAEILIDKNPGWRVMRSRMKPDTWDVESPKQTRAWSMDEDLLEKYRFDCLILDEVHRCNSGGSLQSKICQQISKRVSNVIALTGTPVDKVLLEMFHIYYTVDLGATFGTNFWQFRLEHFEEYGIHDWIARDGHEEIILRQAMPITLSFSKEECTDLPECVDEPLFLEPTEEFRKIEHKILLEEPLNIKGHKDVFKMDSVKATKLRQLTGGFLYLEDKFSYRLKENPKLEALIDLVQGCGYKIIVWYRYNEVGNIIQETMKEMEVLTSRIQGGMTDIEVVDTQAMFQEDSKCRMMISQLSCNEGWDGFAAGITVFWDTVVSPRQREQCIGRMVREGQTQKTMVIDFLLDGTSDVRAYENHDERQQEVDIYMDYMRDYGKRSRNGG